MVHLLLVLASLYRNILLLRVDAVQRVNQLNVDGYCFLTACVSIRYQKVLIYGYHQLGDDPFFPQVGNVHTVLQHIIQTFFKPVKAFFDKATIFLCVDLSVIV